MKRDPRPHCSGVKARRTRATLLAALTSFAVPSLFAQSPLADAFDPGVDGFVESLLVQPDGRILVKGAFQQLGDQPRRGIGRLHPDGDVDSSFDPHPGSGVLAFALEADGGVIVANPSLSLSGQFRRGLGRFFPGGTLDPDFDPSPPEGGIVFFAPTLALQADGKILIGGAPANLGGVQAYAMYRLRPDGSADDTFTTTGGDLRIDTLLVQSDGKIVVGGWFTTLAGEMRKGLGRLFPDGALDPGFNPGIEGGDFEFPTVRALVEQGDGKILVVGEFTRAAGQARTRIARLHPDGTLDQSFSPDANATVNAIALQADGRILLGGYFTSVAGQPRNRIARLHPDGSLDAGFNPGADGPVNALAIQPDGRIVVGGAFEMLAGQPRAGIGRLQNTEPATQNLRRDASTLTWVRGGTTPEVWRTVFEHTADGETWVGLGAGARVPGGWELTAANLPENAVIRAQGHSAGGIVESVLGPPQLVVQPKSRSDDAGTSARFEITGTGSEPLEYQWFKDGEPLSESATASGVASPVLILSGLLKQDEGSYRVAVSNALGSLDSLAAILTVRDPAILVQPGSTIGREGEPVNLSVAASGTPPLHYKWFRNGQAIPVATGPGLDIPSFSAADAGVYTVEVSNIHGTLTSAPAELSVNIAADEEFAAGIDGGIFPQVQSLALQPDGGILVGGDFTVLGGQARSSLGRLHPDGIVDAVFAPGLIEADYPAVTSLAVQPDGKILVGGNLLDIGGEPRVNLGRLHADGTLDAGFDPDVGEVFSAVYALATQEDGRILAGGSFTTLGGQSRPLLGRLHPDGTVDLSFDAQAGGGGDFPHVYALCVQEDGKILVGGGFTQLGGQMRVRIGRLHADGTLDEDFNPGTDGFVETFAVQADGKILVGGRFFNLAGEPRSHLGRLHPDGTPDMTFRPEPDGWVYALAVQADGKILVGGYFSMLGGEPREGIGRLHPDGSVDPAFNPGAEGGDLAGVEALVLQADGRILVGGVFTQLAGEARGGLGRLLNTSVAAQSLNYDGSAVIWMRGGTSPEVWRTTFEYSADGLDWSLLGTGTRIPGGWRLLDVDLPAEGVLRGRGYTAESIVESRILLSPEPIRADIVRDGSTVILSWSGGQGPYQVQQNSGLGVPGDWRNVGDPVDAHSMVFPIGPETLLLRVRGR